jgi:signal transduction histidine kinase
LSVNTVILNTEIHSERDLVFVRRRAQHIAELLGLSVQNQTRVATAVSELARNAFQYAGCGRVCFEIKGETPEALLIRIRDEGPGIPDVDAVFGEDFESKAGLGRGISGAKRLMDRFDISSEPGEGTTIEMAKAIPKASPQLPGLSSKPTADVVEEISEQLARFVDPSPMEAMRRQNQALLQALEEARQARKMRDKFIEKLQHTVRLNELFVGVVSHDLRNPLTAINMAASVLQFQSDSDAIARPAARILASADRMSRLINQILDFTQIRLGAALPLERSETDLHEIACAILEEFEDRDQDLRPDEQRHPIHYEQIGDLVGTWDGDRLSQAISNLVGNARKHGEPGSPVEVRIDGQAADFVRMSVSNCGTISPELLPHIFEPLRREGGENGGAKNLGLGLFITEQIVSAHGGTIEVESTESDGTTFSIEIPRLPPEIVDDGDSGLGEISWIVDES